ncbi:hypothetical protein NQ176_g4622 [Zarea fungicola]|uniref:Uncharacterized protein n=1 Tax=Zarea fungicola TaxID=93591 RepID=A0ACC1NDS1_9HYPO|nr:hypothetical protein NQ176_g4622 [Lecanicillium fungicola]
MKFLQLAALALGANASLQQRDLATFQNTLTSLTGDVVNLDIAVKGILAQLQTVSNNFKAATFTIQAQPVLTAADSLLIAQNWQGLRDKIAQTSTDLSSAKGSIQAASNCKDIYTNSVLVYYWGYLYFSMIGARTDASVNQTYTDGGRSTINQFELVYKSIVCPN